MRADEPPSPRAVVVIGDRGVLIAGRPASGKTALALALLDRCRSAAA